MLVNAINFVEGVVRLDYEFLITRIAAWVENTPDVRAAVILGSRARSDHPADEWSDLDVLVFSHDPEQFIRSAGWVAEFGPVWLSFTERAPDGRSWERRTLYEGGLDVDVAFNPAEALDGIRSDLPPELADILRRGVRVLVDKDGALDRILSLPLPSIAAAQPPSEAEFCNATANFWYHTLWSAKHLRRGELWWAKVGIDMHLKMLLQQMLEWHARARHGGAYDTWLRGRFLEEWADPRAVAQLSTAFAHYNPADLARALRVTMQIYRWLEDESAAAWGFSLDVQNEIETAEETQKTLEIF